MKYISVPVDINAMQRLDFNNNVDGDLVELQLDKNSYDSLLRTNIIDQLNCNLGINIDDFEDEKIDDIDSLILARTIVENLMKTDKSDILAKLLIQVNNAINYKTGLFFYF